MPDDRTDPRPTSPTLLEMVILLAILRSDDPLQLLGVLLGSLVRSGAAPTLGRRCPTAGERSECILIDAHIDDHHELAAVIELPRALQLYSRCETLERHPLPD